MNEFPGPNGFLTSNRTAVLIAVVLSLAFHFALVLLASRATITVHTLPRFPQVQTVIIPPSEKIHFPREVDWTGLPPASSDDWIHRLPGRVSERRRDPSGAILDVPFVGDADLQPVEVLDKFTPQSEDPGASGQYIPEALSEHFAARLTARTGTTDKSDSGLRISLVPKRPEHPKGQGEPAADLRSRARTAGSKKGPGTIIGQGGTGVPGVSRSVRRTASVFISRQAVDMGPWAEAMMARVLSMWTLPAEGHVSRRSQVAISAVIEKDGEISQLDILSGSASNDLDSAALTALKLSSPLHRLPDGFPEPFLEALFLFTYEN